MKRKTTPPTSKKELRTYFIQSLGDTLLNEKGVDKDKLLKVKKQL